MHEGPTAYAATTAIYIYVIDLINRMHDHMPLLHALPSVHCQDECAICGISHGGYCARWGNARPVMGWPRALILWHNRTRTTNACYGAVMHIQKEPSSCCLIAFSTAQALSACEACGLLPLHQGAPCVKDPSSTITCDACALKRHVLPMFCSADARHGLCRLALCRALSALPRPV